MVCPRQGSAMHRSLPRSRNRSLHQQTSQRTLNLPNRAPATKPLRQAMVQRTCQTLTLPLRTVTKELWTPRVGCQTIPTRSPTRNRPERNRSDSRGTAGDQSRNRMAVMDTSIQAGGTEEGESMGDGDHLPITNLQASNHRNWPQCQFLQIRLSRLDRDRYENRRTVGVSKERTVPLQQNAPCTKFGNFALCSCASFVTTDLGLRMHVAIDLEGVVLPQREWETEISRRVRTWYVKCRMDVVVSSCLPWWKLSLSTLRQKWILPRLMEGPITRTACWTFPLTSKGGKQTLKVVKTESRKDSVE